MNHSQALIKLKGLLEPVTGGPTTQDKIYYPDKGDSAFELKATLYGQAELLIDLLESPNDSALSSTLPDSPFNRAQIKIM